MQKLTTILKLMAVTIFVPLLSVSTAQASGEALCRHVFETPLEVKIPILAQETDWTCGTACMRSVLRFIGVGDIPEAKLAGLLGTNPRHGTTPDRIQATAQALGLSVRKRSDLDIQALQDSLSAGHPVITLIQESGSYGHWVVVVGINSTHVKIMDPDGSSARGAYREVPLEDFSENWWHRFSGNKIHRGVGIEIW